MSEPGLSYRDAGVDIDAAHRAMRAHMMIVRHALREVTGA